MEVTCCHPWRGPPLTRRIPPTHSANSSYSLGEFLIRFRDLFDRANAIAAALNPPTSANSSANSGLIADGRGVIVFIDEIDALCPKRSELATTPEQARHPYVINERMIETPRVKG